MVNVELVHYTNIDVLSTYDIHPLLTVKLKNYFNENDVIGIFNYFLLRMKYSFAELHVTPNQCLKKETKRHQIKLK